MGMVVRPIGWQEVVHVREGLVEDLAGDMLDWRSGIFEVFSSCAIDQQQ